MSLEEKDSIEEIPEWKGKQAAMRPRQSGCTDANGVFHPINGIDGVPYDICPRCEKLIANHSFGNAETFLNTVKIADRSWIGAVKLKIRH